MQAFTIINAMVEKKNNKSGMPLIFGGLALLALAGGSKKRKKTTTTNNQQQNGGGNMQDDFINTLPDIAQFQGTVTGQDIVPWIVPSSFEIKAYKHIEKGDPEWNVEDQQYNIARVKFLMAIYCPHTALGSGLQIENFEITDLQFVRWISDQQQEWIRPFENKNTTNYSGIQKIETEFKGKIIHDGFNLFEIQVDFMPWISTQRLIQNNYVFYDYEAISMGINVKYQETRLNHWRLLSAWNIKEDTLFNEGDAFGTNTRFGVVRNYKSKPRAERGLFGEWWAEYVSKGYDTEIIPIRGNNIYGSDRTEIL